MTSFADLKTKRILRLVKWLVRHKGVKAGDGGRHNTKVTVIHTGQSYPLSTSHSVMNKHVVQDFMEWLAKNGICTEQEFMDHI